MNVKAHIGADLKRIRRYFKRDQKVDLTEFFNRCIEAADREPTRVIRQLKRVKRMVGKEEFEKQFIQYKKNREIFPKIAPFLFGKVWRDYDYE